jgi:hypothetical protein
MISVPVPLKETNEKPYKPSKILPIKESKKIKTKYIKDLTMSRVVDKLESSIPKIEVKSERKSKVLVPIQHYMKNIR